jgi:hypothetical protein
MNNLGFYSCKVIGSTCVINSYVRLGLSGFLLTLGRTGPINTTKIGASFTLEPYTHVGITHVEQPSSIHALLDDWKNCMNKA